MFKRLINWSSFPILCSLVLQTAGLLLFAATDLKSILPAGNSELVDLIYGYSGTVTILYYIIVVLISVLLFPRKSPLFIRLFISLAFLIAGVTNNPWITVLLAPLFIEKPPTREIDRTSNIHYLQIILSALVIGSFFLMTIQSSFPHDEFKRVAYLQGFSTIFMFILVLAIILVVIFSGSLDHWSRRFSRGYLSGGSAMISLALFLVLLFYGNQKLSSFVTQFELDYAPSMVAGFVTAIFLLFIAPFDTGHKGLSGIETLYSPLVSRFFWFKFFVISLAFRHLIVTLGKSEQDILIIILYDYISISAPILILILSFGLASRFAEHVRSRLFAGGIALVILLPVIFSIVVASESWTILSDIRTPYSKFITSNSRKILTQTHLLNRERIIDRRVRNLESLIANGEQLKADVREVFFHEGNRNRYSSIPYPYIFVFIADGVYAGHTSIHGYKRDTTPFLSRFQKEAVNFTQFHASSSATGLSITSLFSGSYRGNNDPAKNSDEQLLCDSLVKSGYTSFVARWSGCKKRRETGQAELIYLNQAGKKKKDREVIWKYIEENPDKPVFAYVHVKGGHGPWKLENGNRVFGDGRVDIYDALILRSDSEFKEFVEKIKELKIYDQSIIIYTSDHGIGLGYKNNDFTIYSNMYNVNMHIPFLIRIPGVNAKTVKSHYSLVDIRPTIEELIGYDSPQVHQGLSFAGEIRDDLPESDRCVFAIATYSDRYAMKCPDGIRVVYNRDWSYLNIYDTRQDPYEQKGLIEQIPEEEFIKLIKPFARFMAFGRDSYSKPY